MSSGHETETLRFPATLDHAGIVARLVGLRAVAQDLGLSGFVSILASVETLAPAQLGLSVISAMTWLQGKPEHQFMAKQMEMLAVNLKNLK